MPIKSDKYPNLFLDTVIRLSVIAKLKLSRYGGIMFGIVPALL